MSELKNKFYASTGTIVGRANNFDYNVIIDHAKDIRADGIEFMMLSVWYNRIDEIAEALKKAGIYTPVIHFDKYIGVMLADGDEKTIFLLSVNARMFALPRSTPILMSVPPLLVNSIYIIYFLHIRVNIKN